MPVTAHAVFHKAGHCFDVEPISVPVDTDTWKADVDALAAARVMTAPSWWSARRSRTHMAWWILDQRDR
ncbi:MAG: hypothetical protein R2789_02095 [Microthrixaceae bacterium]